MPEAWSIAVRALTVIGLLAFATWVVATFRRDVSLVDRVWSLMIFAGAAACAWQWPQVSARAAIVLVLIAAWGARLAVYITARNWGHGEDRRYQQIRANNQPNFALKSLYLVFGLQAVLAWAVSTPALASLMSTRPLGWLDAPGVALAVFGIVFEATADAQMSAFKRDPSNRGRVMDRGLWRFTRHPNYFGEVCCWWGLFLIALAGGWSAWWSIVSPAIMTFLLLKVSGVTMLEKDIGERRPAYRDYIARTNAFIPGPPRKGIT